MIPLQQTIAEKIKDAQEPYLFDEYDAFVKKFKPKKTTDDCYTPPKVYDAVVEWVKQEAGLPDDVKITRPFYPENDYRDIKHYENKDVVIDNPPFSILSQIVYYYEERKIPYFLFAPTLTLFSTGSGTASNYIIASANIRYENGANVQTSFVSNLFGDNKIICDYRLHEAIREANAGVSAVDRMPKYDYPPQVITAARMTKTAPYAKLKIKKDETFFIRGIASNKQGLFGCGFLISEKAAAEKAAAEKAAAKKTFVFELSENEKKIVERLGK